MGTGIMFPQQPGTSATTTKARRTTRHGSEADRAGRSDWPGGWGGRRRGTVTPGAPVSCDRSVQRPVHCREPRGHGTLLPYDGLDDNPTLEVGMTTHRSPPTKCSSFYLAHQTIFYKLIYVIKIYCI